MARSSYIYVVMGTTQPIAVFTVKHECQSWIGRNHPASLRTIIRMRDGSQDGKVHFTEEEFMFGA